MSCFQNVIPNLLLQSLLLGLYEATKCKANTKKSTYRGSKETVKALSAYVKLMRAAEFLTVRIHRNLADVNLTISQFGTLKALYHLGPMTQVEIGTKILKSSGNMTLVIDNLEKSGFVRRERSKEDRRHFTVHLTEGGKKLVGEFLPAHALTRV